MAPTRTFKKATPIYFQLPMTPIPHACAKSPSRDSATYPKPLCRMQLNDLSHKGTADFLSVVDPATIIPKTVATVLRLLYGIDESSIAAQADAKASKTIAEPAIPTASVLPLQERLPTPPKRGEEGPQSTAPVPEPQLYPPVRSITLLLRAIDGVGYTTGLDLDDEHKEIHLNINYVSSRSAELLKSEIAGFLCHEMVHVWQWNGQGTCNGGLIEGIADWVRLRAGLAPPHWKRRRGQKWDQGYETTGYFLEWLETVRCGAGTVRAVNRWLRKRRYDETKLWEEVCGKGVEALWGEYEAWVEKEGLFGED